MGSPYRTLSTRGSSSLSWDTLPPDLSCISSLILRWAFSSPSPTWKKLPTQPSALGSGENSGWTEAPHGLCHMKYHKNRKTALVEVIRFDRILLCSILLEVCDFINHLGFPTYVDALKKCEFFNLLNAINNISWQEAKGLCRYRNQDDPNASMFMPLF